MSSLPHLTSYFEDFLKNIRLEREQTSALIEAHTQLRDRLKQDESLGDAVVATFLQGSYRRATIIKPTVGQSSDVDVVVVTNLSEDEYTPSQALDFFGNFLERYYKGEYKRQGRSWGIKLGDAEMDLVPTSAPSEAAATDIQSFADFPFLDIEILPGGFPYRNLPEHQLREDGLQLSGDSWKSEPLRIPDREAGTWEDTDPLSQIKWTSKKNGQCNSHYINVVKAIKWWWRSQYPDRKYPKGYPLEHLIGDCCPDGIPSVTEGVVLTLESIMNIGRTKPCLPDRGLPSNDVMERVSQKDYGEFYDAICIAGETARCAFDATEVKEAADKWRELFGEEFPPAPESLKRATFTERVNRRTTLGEARFA